MKIKDGFMVRTVAGSNIVVPVGSATVDFNGILTLNDTALFIWNALKEDKTEQQLLDAMLEEYDVDKDTAAADISVFLSKLKDANLVE